MCGENYTDKFMITLIPLYKSKNKNKAEYVYNHTFCRDETVNILYIKYLMLLNRADFLVAEEDDIFRGIVYLLRNKEFVYLFYLVVDKEHRQEGYGSKILHEVNKIYGDRPIVITIESPYEEEAENIDERKKRLKFYEKNGYSLINESVNDFGINYELISTSENVTKDKFLLFMRKNYFLLYFLIVYYKNEGIFKYLIRQ